MNEVFGVKEALREAGDSLWEHYLYVMQRDDAARNFAGVNTHMADLRQRAQEAMESSDQKKIASDIADVHSSYVVTRSTYERNQDKVKVHLYDTRQAVREHLDVYIEAAVHEALKDGVQIHLSPALSD